MQRKDEESKETKETKENVNVLSGIKCPVCGATKRFDIEGTATFIVYDDGSEDFFDLDWNDWSMVECQHCHHRGRMFEFNGKGESTDELSPKGFAIMVGCILEQYYSTKRDDSEDVNASVRDILADIRHYCDAHGIAFGEIDSRAYDSYLTEKSHAKEKP